MYSWIWRHLPGPMLLRLALSFALVVAVVGLQFFVVFPAVDPHLPFNHVTVDKGSGGG